MKNVLEFKKPEPEALSYIEGTALCLQCGHQWLAKIYKQNGVGLPIFKCEKCHCIKAVWKHFLECEEGTEILVCRCGASLFTILRHGGICVSCGERLEW